MNISYKTLTVDDLYELLVDYNLDDPYVKLEELSEEIKYFNLNGEAHYEGTRFFCAYDGDDLVGVAKLFVGDRGCYAYPGWKNWISFCSVRKGYFGFGIGKRLLEELFKYAAVMGLDVLTSGYSLRGWLHLRKYVHIYTAKYGVDLNDPETKPSFLDWEKFEGFANADEYEDVLQTALKNKVLT
jgi:GNAT superfamily N-acetyltransferase